MRPISELWLSGVEAAVSQRGSQFSARDTAIQPFFRFGELKQFQVLSHITFGAVDFQGHFTVHCEPCGTTD